MKITAVSDLHGNLINIEPCDTLLICGDISPLEIQRDHIQMTKWFFNEFQNWISLLPCDKVILTPGNHDFWFEKFITQPRTYLFDKLTILIDGDCSILYSDEFYGDNRIPKYITIYGTPQCRYCGHWAYMNNSEELHRHYQGIPYNIDILMCHDAPNIGHVGIETHNRDVMDFSNKILGYAITEKKPNYVICGHVHEGAHELKEIDVVDASNISHTVKIANCSILNDDYKINYKPLTFEI